ncbi:MAG: PucR family transcriptional regulator [Gemmatimonadota bacterium]
MRDLVDQPHLRLEVLAAASGLDRMVTWAHSSDLPEPWDWLSGGELLMKNGRTLPRSAAGQIGLLEGLAAAGVSALLIGTDPDTPPLSSRAVALAGQLGLPVLRVPYSVSFIEVSRAVADASLLEEAGRLARAGRIYAAIGLAVAGADSAAFLRRLERELGCRLYVLDKATGSPVLDGTPAPGAGLAEALLAALDRRGGAVPGLLRVDGPPVATVAVEIPYEEPTLLVAQARASRPPGRPPELALLQHAATAAAVEVAHATLRQDHDRQAGTALLTQLLDGRLEPPAAQQQLAAHGITPAGARLLATTGSADEQQRRLHIALRRRGISHLLLRRGSVFFVLLGEGAEEPAGRTGAAADAAVTAVRERLGGGQVTAGVSNLLGTPARAPEAAREAMWALGAAARRPDRVARYGDAVPLPALRDPAEAQALVDRTLGALLEYDRAAGSQLVRSLAAFLSCRRSWQRTARRLNVHRQTVVYRMDRVAQLTGRTLTETADIAELWLALSALELLTGEMLLAAGDGAAQPG